MPSQKATKPSSCRAPVSSRHPEIDYNNTSSPRVQRLPSQCTQPLVGILNGSGMLTESLLVESLADVENGRGGAPHKQCNMPDRHF